ncbi:MAG: hypothetical protein DMG46_17850 [Acidobacteria bacterium]|nr:MAG: hypothetical protein DMG46_17850 [Acidobacteriota bacterium]
MVTTAAAHHYHKQYRKEYSRHFHSPRTSGFFLILEESRLPPSVHETDAVAFRAARLSLFWDSSGFSGFQNIYSRYTN